MWGSNLGHAQPRSGGVFGVYPDSYRKVAVAELAELALAK